MPQKPPTRRRKDARPNEILAAALALFGEKGFAATRLDDVAARAGISKGTVYLYFPTKEDLFRAVLRQDLLPNIAAMEAEVAAHAGSSSELMRRIAGRLHHVLTTDLTVIPKLVLAESGNFPAIARIYADEVVQRGMTMLAGILTRGMERGEFRRLDPAAVVPGIVAPFLVMALWKHSLARHTAIRMDPLAVLETHIDLLLRGLTTEPLA
jgi:AcrR family transcriptional regulator